MGTARGMGIGQMAFTAAGSVGHPLPHSESMGGVPLPRDKISDPATIGRRSGPGEVVTWERGSAWGEQLRAVYPPSVKDDGGLSTLRPWFIKGKRKVTLLRKIRVTLICFTSF